MKQKAKRKSSRLLNRAEQTRAGKALRQKVPRKQHQEWKPERDGRRDPIEILEKSNRGRMPELVSLRYGRTLLSPFTFLRGSAAVMARDLAKTSATGLRVQACGDCHLMNFGLFATPERHLTFDINDFDETHPAPWEWDLKRLATSFVVAAQDVRLSGNDCTAVAMACAQSYRKRMSECAAMTPIELWYQHVDIETLIGQAPDAKARKFRQQLAKKRGSG